MWMTTNCGKFLKRWEYKPPYLLPEKPVYGQEATVRTRCETMNWFQVGKEVHQGCILPPCLFNFYEEYIMPNVKLDESQVGKIILWFAYIVKQTVAQNTETENSKYFLLLN